ncbi:MAG: pyruvate dehydrogenase complex E1 component subunit beta [Candidatus Bathyarchaeia archaeon]
MVELTNSDLIEMYKIMLLSRRFDEKLIELWKQRKPIPTPHVCIGHEAVGTGACYKLPNEHIVQPYYRTLTAYYARGISAKQMMLDVFCKQGSSSKGRSLYTHFICPEKNFLNYSGMVGTQLPIAAGVALAIKLRKEKRVVLSFFGDGHVSSGDFHEALNMASIWKLPVIFICENNEVSAATTFDKHSAVKDVAQRAAAYAIPSVIVDGTDVLKVHEVIQESVKKVLNGAGPILIECKVVRLRPHGEIFAEDTRPPEVIKKLWERDPITKFEKFLKERGVVTDEVLKEIDKKILSEIEEAVEYAEKSPNLPKETLFEDVYGEEIKIATKIPDITPQTRIAKFRRALREAIVSAMRKNKNIFVMGLDVTYGYFVKNLAKEFGEERVIDTPISESGFVGVAVGAAMMGMRPIVEIQSADFVLRAVDQLVNGAAKWRYAYGGKISVPVVIRFPQGAGGHFGLVHEQSVHPLFTNVPGLKIVFPSTPFDAKGLMAAAIEDNDPVIFLEPKLMYDVEGPVPEEEYFIPLGKADVKKEGDDVTVVAYGPQVYKALNAAETLKKEGISVEVIDPRTLIPLDEEAILKSVRKTGRVVVTIEECKTSGFAAELSALVAEKAFEHLKAPIKRVCNPFTPIPNAINLEEYWLSFTSEKSIEEAVRGIVKK